VKFVHSACSQLRVCDSAFEARRTESLIYRQNSKIFNFLAARIAIIGTVAYQRTITEQEMVCIRVEECSTVVASEAIEMPSIANYNYQRLSSSVMDRL
jgi:hypothetical protein